MNGCSALRKSYSKVLTNCAVIAALTTGCATGPKFTPEMQAELDSPLICSSPQECKEMWERATYFVSTAAGFKLQIANDSIIETFNPSPNSPHLAMRVVREPLGGGRYRIAVSAWCDNIFGCQPNQKVAIAAGKRYIRTGPI